MVLRHTPQAVTPFGGLRVFMQFLVKIGFRKQVRRGLPVHGRPPNVIESDQAFTAFLTSVLAGARYVRGAVTENGQDASPWVRAEVLEARSCSAIIVI